MSLKSEHCGQERIWIFSRGRREVRRLSQPGRRLEMRLGRRSKRAAACADSGPRRFVVAAPDATSSLAASYANIAFNSICDTDHTILIDPLWTISDKRPGIYELVSTSPALPRFMIQASVYLVEVDSIKECGEALGFNISSPRTNSPNVFGYVRAPNGEMGDVAVGSVRSSEKSRPDSNGAYLLVDADTAVLDIAGDLVRFACRTLWQERREDVTGALVAIAKSDFKAANSDVGDVSGEIYQLDRDVKVMEQKLAEAQARKARLSSRFSELSDRRIRAAMMLALLEEASVPTPSPSM